MALLSDKHPEENSRSRVVSRRKQYTDLDLSLKLHPIRKDIISLKDDEAIKNSVRHLIITNFFERPFQPTLGGNLRGLLFEPADTITKNALQRNIIRVLKVYEPRIQVFRVIVEDLADQNAYRISVTYNIKEYDTKQDVEIRLQRLR